MWRNSILKVIYGQNIHSKHTKELVSVSHIIIEILHCKKLQKICSTGGFDYKLTSSPNGKAESVAAKCNQNILLTISNIAIYGNI